MSDRHMSIMERLGFRRHSEVSNKEKALRPNRLTRKVIRDADRGKNLSRAFHTVEDLMKDLES